ncbi:O-antigen ligase family protein [Sphingomonas radiodurans]|uniref:O-antigen ligase family protein n=1 Tax=Sphingomonas radiodurans TaxID=2890321 RepID=UPI001E4FEAE9|nr:O-antigen ligase family protein [Sphingomonas radiodurans]WBH15110.1 O-antigen ligase family protein [Sphingomonas radiodurans]
MVALLWIAGGASRGDAIGQVIVRAGCWAILIASILGGTRPSLAQGRPVAILLAATIVLPLIQLIPLPPTWWQALPGREVLLIPGEASPWRPWTMTPGATTNALASLIVPVTMLVLLTQANDRVSRWLPTILLGMIAAATLLGLMQFSGAGFNSPFLNDTPGVVSSIFANRNHFALMLAMGCVIAPVWAFMDLDALRWRGPLAGGLVLLFVLTILATGSRAGALLGVLALAMAALLVGRRIRRRLRRAPGWVFPALIAFAVLVVGGFVALSFLADRAQSIDRLIESEGGEDMRSRALPTVLSMIVSYMPFGSGFGGFDPIFRIHEPFDLLKLTYFNQAHNDYLGIALDGGLAGIALLVVGVIWWFVVTIRIWQAPETDRIVLSRLGSTMILLVLVASITDYPARTPTIMALLVVAALWLARGNVAKPQATLPDCPTNL